MKKKNNNPTEDRDQSNVTESKKCCSHRKCKFCCAFFIIALVILFAVGVYHYNKNSLSKLSEEMHVIEESKKGSDLNISKLEENVSSLKTEVSKIVTKDVECTVCKKLELRKKWKTWLALKEKMEAGEPFNKELIDFNVLFSYDKELVEIVNDLAKGVDVISSVKDEDHKVLDICKKYFRKIVRIKKIDYRKLLEVSGYVLSSIEGYN